ncbi:hypothetical protein Tco_0025474 [Tanacetum coccineum]
MLGTLLLWWSSMDTSSEQSLHTDLSPRPSPTTNIHDSVPEPSGENLGGHSSSDRSLSRNEGDMTLQSVYDLCLSLCAQVSDQAKEIQALKAQITKLKKQAKPVIKHHQAYLKSVSLKQRFPRKSFLKKHRVHKESVSKQGRKFAKGESSVQRDPMFDEIPKDTVDHMDTENARDEGRTREMVDEDKEIYKRILSTEDILCDDKEGVSTDMEKVSTDRPIVSTDGFKVSTDRKNEGTEEHIGGTEENFEGSEEHIEGTEEQVESTDGHKKGTEEEIATQATQTSIQTPTSTIFGDDETIAKVLLNMSQAKAVSREKEKGVEVKDIEDTDIPKSTSTRSLLTLKPLPKIDPKDKGKKKIEEEDESESESDGIPEAEKKFKQLESDEEMARKMQEEWEGEEERNRIAEEKAANEALIRNFDDIKARIEADRLLAEKLQEQEREQFTIEERAKFLHDTIAAQRKFLAQQRSEAIRNRPPTKNQLRNQMMTYLKHVGNFKHAELKIKKFEEVQALYEKIKRSDEDFISIGSAEDERLIKRMNEKGVDSSKSEVIKEETKEEVQKESKEEESTRKRKLGTRKKMKSRKRRYIQNTSEDDSDKENDELRLHLTIAPDEEKEVDYEILDRKYPIKEWKTESNGQKRYFSTLMSVLSIFDREDLNVVYQLVMDRFQDEMPEGFDRVLWGDLMVLFNPDDKDEFWNSQLDWKIVSWKLHSSSGVHTLVTKEGVVIHMLVEKKYPLRKEVLMQMLKLKLESEEDSTMALELIKFVKKILAELEPEEHKNWLVHKQTACGKDFLNPFMVDNLPKIVRFSTHLASVVKSWLVHDQTVHALASPKANELAIPEQAATGKGTSNPLMAGSLPKTTKPTYHRDHFGKFDEKADDGLFLGYSPMAKAFRVFNIIRQEMEETYHVTFSEDDEAISKSSTEGDEVNFNENRSFPYDEFIIPMNKVPQSSGNNDYFLYVHNPELKPDAILKLTLLMINNILDEHVTLISGRPWDLWSKEKHIELVNILGEPQAGVTTRSKIRDSKAASAHECLYVNFLFKIEPKKLIEALEEEGWIIDILEAIGSFLQYAAPWGSRGISDGCGKVHFEMDKSTGSIMFNNHLGLKVVNFQTIGMIWPTDVSKQLADPMDEGGSAPKMPNLNQLEKADGCLTKVAEISPKENVLQTEIGQFLEVSLTQEIRDCVIISAQEQKNGM